jgi:hypothetical protein
MNHALKVHKNDTRWLALIDVDEYIVPMKVNSIPEVLADYEEFAALCPHWVLFGSSGHKHFEDKPVVERFTWRAAETDRHIKSIARPPLTHDWVTVHKFTHSGLAVDENKVPIAMKESRPENPTENIIRINHYVTKSYDECVERRGRPRADINALHEMPEFFDGHDRNEVEDLRALKLWEAMK